MISVRKGFGAFCVLVAYTDPQKVPEAFTDRNHLLLLVPTRSRRGGDTVLQQQLSEPENRALELTDKPFRAAIGELRRRDRTERGVLRAASR